MRYIELSPLFNYIKIVKAHILKASPFYFYSFQFSYLLEINEQDFEEFSF